LTSIHDSTLNTSAVGLGVRLPEDLCTWTASVGLAGGSPELRLSPTALCLTLRLPAAAAPPRPSAMLDAALAHLCNTIIRISEVAGVSRPLIVIVDVSAQESARSTLQQLADNSAWHQGEWALYICPVQLAPLAGTGTPDEAGGGSALEPWMGPMNATELATALLQPTVVEGRALPNITDITVRDLARALTGRGKLNTAFRDALLLDNNDERLRRIGAFGEAELLSSAGSPTEAQSS
jgi:hypothetical protein